jgi:hypothetical protein
MLEPMLAAHGALIAADGRGYVIVQRSNANALIGPWLAGDAGVARDLLDIALVRTGDRSPMLFVPSTNQAAVELAAAAGFVPRRTLRHMIRGLGETPSPVVFGRANLGHG